MEISRIIRRGIENRGLEDIEFPQDLALAAKALDSAESVMILTGFCVRSAMKGETDGPLGTISLAGALSELGKSVAIVTDEFSREMIEQGLAKRSLQIPVESVSREEADMISGVLIDKYRVDHMISIERTGRAADGNSYSMRGEILSDIIPQLDGLFLEAKERGIPTTAIGDGGNEIGMGKVEAGMRGKIHKGDVIWCETSCDYLIVASVSNWGGHALAALLGILNGKNLLHGFETEKIVLEAIVDAGSVDGCTRKREMTVDSLSLEENLGVVENLRKIVDASIA